MKRICILFSTAIFLIVCLTLVGCGGPSKDTLYILSYKPEYTEFFEEVNKVFLEENPEIKKIDYKCVDTNDYNTVFTSRINSKYLDVFTSEVTYMMQGHNNYMAELPIESFSDIQDKYLELGSFYDPSSSKDPKLYTIPMEEVANVVFYNKNIFSEYGLEVPTTWDEFINILEVFDDASINHKLGKTHIASPLIFGGKSEWPSMTMLNAVVADTVSEDFFNAITNYKDGDTISFTGSDWTDSISKVKTLANYIDKSEYGIDYSFAASYFSTGNKTVSPTKYYPMMIDGTWAYSQIKGDFEVGAFALPASNENSSKKNLPTKCGVSLSVFNKSNKIDYAIKYLELCFRDDMYKKFIEFTKTPSIKDTINQDNQLITSIFDSNKYNFISAYDSRMPRYFPIVNSSSLISVMKGELSVDKLLSDLQEQVNLSKEDWKKYTNLKHKKD